MAALGIVKKLDQLPSTFPSACPTACSPLLAYHYAAGQQGEAPGRLPPGGRGISLLFALVCLVLF